VPRKAEDQDEASQRRCIATGQSGPKAELIRCVVAPDGLVVPDFAEKLPGRGIWVASERAVVADAMKRKLFARAARRQVTVPDDLVDRLENGLVDRVASALGLARRAGLVVAGQAKVEAALRDAGAAIRIEALDGAADGRRKLDRLAPETEVLGGLTMEELGRVFDRERVVHAAFLRGGEKQGGEGLLARLRRECSRLAGFRPDSGGPGLENMAERCIEPRTDLIGKDCAVTE